MDQLQLQEISEDDKETSPKNRYNSVNSLQEKNDKDVKKFKFFQLYSGMLFATLSVIGMLVFNIIARYLKHYHTTELMAYRVMVEIVILVPILIQQRIEFTFKTQAPLLHLRGILMSSTFFFNTYATQILPLSESQAIIFSTPIVTAILGRIFLKYEFTKVKISALLVNIIGLILVCHFWTIFESERYLGLGSAFLFALITATSNIVLKILTFDLPTKLVVFHVAWMRLVTMMVLTEITNNLSIPTIPECPDNYKWYQSEPVLIFLMGIAILGYSTFDAEAVKRENPSTVAAVKSFIAMPLVVFSQMIVFNDVPNVDVILGVILVLIASLLINIDGIVDKLNPESKLRSLIIRINN